MMDSESEPKQKLLFCQAELPRNSISFGWQVELGVNADVLSIGAEAAIGIFPTEDGGKQFDARAGVSPGIFGWGFIVRVKVPG